MEKAAEEHDAHALPNQHRGQKRPQYKGIRMRKWGSWGSEIRMPKTRAKIWLGSYKTAKQAARAYDAAVYCLRGPNAKFNFPGSVPVIPSPFSLSRQEIQVAAARYARDELPSISTSTSPSPSPLNSNNKNNNDKPREEERECSSRSSLVSETLLSSDCWQQISEEQDMALWEFLFDGSGENFPSIDEALALDAIPTWQEQEQEQDGFLWNLSELLTDRAGKLYVF